MTSQDTLLIHQIHQEHFILQEHQTRQEHQKHQSQVFQIPP